MRIENLRREERADGAIVSADLIWEACEGPVKSLYFETQGAAAEELTASPEAFAVACLPAAALHGEARIRLDAELCPRLHEGLATVQAIFSSWYDWFQPVSVETTGGFRVVSPAPDRRAACFLSGGVDSLALLRANRLHFPLDHPSAFRDCITVMGLNIYDLEESPRAKRRRSAFEEHLARLRQLADRARFELLTVQTNTRALYPSFDSWASIGFGSGILSSAHAFQGRVTSVWLASGADGVDPPPKATHPLLDRHFSSAAVDVHHGQTSLTRLQKTRLLGDWSEAGDALQVCLRPDPPASKHLNCGECGKCIRTMLAFLVDGRLGRMDAFPYEDVSPAMVKSMEIERPHDVAYCAELIEPLQSRGREDLARALASKLEAATPTKFGEATARRLARRDSQAEGTAGSVVGRLIRAWFGR